MDRISHLRKENVSGIMSLIKDVIKTMDDQGIPQWDEIYPDQKRIESDLEEQNIYGLWIENTLAGIIVLNEFQDKEYQEIKWSLVDAKPLVIHRLCVSPMFQGRGFAKLLVEFAEKYARENNYRSIRLDAFVRNPASLGLYRSLGYTERGVVTFRKGEFYCFEKLL